MATEINIKFKPVGKLSIKELHLISTVELNPFRTSDKIKEYVRLVEDEYFRRLELNIKK